MVLLERVRIGDLKKRAVFKKVLNPCKPEVVFAQELKRDGSRSRLSADWGKALKMEVGCCLFSRRFLMLLEKKVSCNSL